MYSPTLIKLLLAMAILIIATGRTATKLNDRNVCRSSDLLTKCVASYQTRIDACHADKLVTDIATTPEANTIRRPPPPPTPCETCSLAISICKKRDCNGGDKKCQDGCLCWSYNNIPMCKRCDWVIRACRSVPLVKPKARPE